MRMRTTVLGLMLVLAGTPAVFAQTGKHVPVGVGLVINEFDDGNFSQDNPSPTVEYRIRLKPGSRHGWNWTPSGGFDWYRPDVSRDIQGQSTRLGQLRARPVMVGIEREYTEGP